MYSAALVAVCVQDVIINSLPIPPTTTLPPAPTPYLYLYPLPHACPCPAYPCAYPQDALIEGFRVVFNERLSRLIAVIRPLSWP